MKRICCRLLLARTLLVLVVVSSASGSLFDFQAESVPPTRRRGFSRNKASSSDGESREGSKHTAVSRINQLLSLTRKSIVASGRKNPIFLSVATAASLAPVQTLFHNKETIRRAVYFWTRAGPTVVHYRFTQWWLDHRNADKERRDRVYDRLHDRYCRPSLEIVLHLKGLYIKIGQVLSARPDFIPRQYVDLFATVQDSIPQLPYEDVEQIVRRNLAADLGADWEDVFESMEPDALGSASIGQCHKAVLKPDCWQSSKEDGYNGGREVAVKVMHPGVQNIFGHDLQVFRWLVRLALPGWMPMLRELEQQVMTEFDYRSEAGNLNKVRSNMSRFTNRVTVPRPIDHLCCKELLVMEMLNGKKLTEAIEDKLVSVIGGGREEARLFVQKKREAFIVGNEDVDILHSDLVQSIGMGRISLANRIRRGARMVKLYLLARHIQKRVDLLCDVHGHQIFIDGVFNGDAHPGNILELTGGKLGLIDYGQTKELSDFDRLAIARVVSELGKKSEDTPKIAAAMRECGFRTKFDKDDVLVKYAKLFFDSDVEAKQCGCPNPQLYLMLLSEMDPLEHVPDAAILVARASYLFRGMGSMIENQVRTSKKWRRIADEALSRALQQ